MSEVNQPRIEHFKPEYTDYTQQLALGPKFLASLFKSAPSEKRERRFARKLLNWIRAEEIAYKRLLVNRHALDEAATHLKKDESADDAFECVTTVLSSEIFEIRGVRDEEFESACNTFCEFDDHDGAMTDFITKTFLERSNTSYLATWDGHYRAFEHVKPLPRCDY